MEESKEIKKETIIDIIDANKKWSKIFSRISTPEALPDYCSIPRRNFKRIYIYRDMFFRDVLIIPNLDGEKRSFELIIVISFSFT